MYRFNYDTVDFALGKIVVIEVERLVPCLLGFLQQSSCSVVQIDIVVCLRAFNAPCDVQTTFCHCIHSVNLLRIGRNHQIGKRLDKSFGNRLRYRFSSRFFGGLYSGFLSRFFGGLYSGLYSRFLSRLFGGFCSGFCSGFFGRLCSIICIFSQCQINGCVAASFHAVCGYAQTEYLAFNDIIARELNVGLDSIAHGRKFESVRINEYDIIINDISVCSPTHGYGFVAYLPYVIDLISAGNTDGNIYRHDFRLFRRFRLFLSRAQHDAHRLSVFGIHAGGISSYFKVIFLTGCKVGAVNRNTASGRNNGIKHNISFGIGDFHLILAVRFFRPFELNAVFTDDMNVAFISQITACVYGRYLHFGNRLGSRFGSRLNRCNGLGRRDGSGFGRRFVSFGYLYGYGRALGMIHGTVYRNCIYSNPEYLSAGKLSDIELDFGFIRISVSNQRTVAVSNLIIARGKLALYGPCHRNQSIFNSEYTGGCLGHDVAYFDNGAGDFSNYRLERRIIRKDSFLCFNGCYTGNFQTVYRLEFAHRIIGHFAIITGTGASEITKRFQSALQFVNAMVLVTAAQRYISGILLRITGEQQLLHICAGDSGLFKSVVTLEALNCFLCLVSVIRTGLAFQIIKFLETVVHLADTPSGVTLVHFKITAAERSTRGVHPFKSITIRSTGRLDSVFFLEQLYTGSGIGTVYSVCGIGHISQITQTFLHFGDSESSCAIRYAAIRIVHGARIGIKQEFLHCLIGNTRHFKTVEILEQHYGITGTRSVYTVNFII